MVDEKIDWLWRCVGVPFGIVYLAVFVIPVNMDITSNMGVLFGGFIATLTILK